jgi:hypothetical protein
MIGDEAFGWATVTALGPLKIRIDGAASDSPVDLDINGGVWLVGDRVMWSRSGRQLLVVGDPRAPGEIMLDTTVVPPNALWLLCDGTSYPRAAWPRLMKRWGITTTTGTAPFGQADTTHFFTPSMNLRFPQGVTASGNIGVGGGNTGHGHTLSNLGHAMITLGSQVFARLVSAPAGETYTDHVTATGWTAVTSGGTLASGVPLRGTTDTNTDTRPPYVSFAYFLKAA